MTQRLAVKCSQEAATPIQVEEIRLHPEISGNAGLDAGQEEIMSVGRTFDFELLFRSGFMRRPGPLFLGASCSPPGRKVLLRPGESYAFQVTCSPDNIPEFRKRLSVAGAAVAVVKWSGGQSSFPSILISVGLNFLWPT